MKSTTRNLVNEKNPNVFSILIALYKLTFRPCTILMWRVICTSLIHPLDFIFTFHCLNQNYPMDRIRIDLQYTFESINCQAMSFLSLIQSY